MHTDNHTGRGKLVEMLEPPRTRAGLSAYLDRETVEKVAILRARLGLDNSKLIKRVPSPRPAKPPKPQPPKPPAPPPLRPMVEEALALIERLPPPTPDDREMNELIRRTWELLHDRRVTAQSPPGYRKSNTGGREKRTTGALGEVIGYCFGNYAHWRKIQKSPEPRQ
jgi:hypothetical protein